MNYSTLYNAFSLNIYIRDNISRKEVPLWIVFDWFSKIMLLKLAVGIDLKTIIYRGIIKSWNEFLDYISYITNFTFHILLHIIVYQ